ncbi:MAG: 4Fe-4S binding protein [Elusimicrobia bacterium]|jgi:NADH:ubiquinone oxidoreductase subunit F (NADH-binding)/NAD-dependent dihydropyrimidine dehydrogenase PreA subunit/(2Fe-2S) ferredoxin|nr:4Fe-4S binding protein [Elusimicrobiota bacterium]
MEKNELLKFIKTLPEFASERFINSFFGKDFDRNFNEFTRINPKKPVIFIGAGTCGLAAGAGKVEEKVREYLGEKKIDAEIVDVGCIGYCAGEPLLDIMLEDRNRISFQKVSEANVYEIMDSIFNKKLPAKAVLLGQFDGPNPWDKVPFINKHPFFAKQKRFVLENCGIINPLSIYEYVSRGGYVSFLKAITTMRQTELCDMVERSGLRGRGGGGFPTGKKWKLALEQDSHEKYIICNADEGDPGAFMDRAVIEGDPHRVLEGILIGAYAIGASKAYVYIRAEYPLAVTNLKKAIEDAREKGLIGENVYDSGFSIDVIIKMGAGAFVCGEETALMHSIEGKRGMPKPRPPYPAVKGLFDKPSVINNVETFANISTIIRNGWESFAAIGTKNSKGTKVFALSGNVKRTGLVEIPMGMTMREIIFDIGGGIENDLKFKAVQIGGPSGGCIPTEKIDTEIDYESLKQAGAIMGSGGLVVMDERTCMVDVAKYFMNFITNESCGKCVPCREGTKRLLEILESITRNRKEEKGSEALMRFKGIIELENLANVIKDTSLCGLGQTAPNPVLSTLRWFKNEYEAHIFERKCPAKACINMLEYTINTSKCKGCTLCAKNCPSKAIIGETGKSHYIVKEKCISCGSCKNVCKFGAVEVN